MYAVTGANGQLGRIVIDRLLARVPADRIVATLRRPDQGDALRRRGVTVRQADYDRPDTLDAAFAGVDRLLLISGSEVGRRTPQHRAVVAAAGKAGVGLIAYTSLLHADTSPLGLAPEHRETEALLARSGVPHVLLRNGWYTENHLAGLPAVLRHGVVPGAAGDGRISSAARADYAEAAVAVLTADEDQAGRTYELAGDRAWTLADLAAEIGRQAGRTINHQDLPEEAYAAMLRQSGLPDPVAALLADCDAGAARGALFDDRGVLRRLIGRATTPLADTVAAALSKQA